jgi:hypothetical protein
MFIECLAAILRLDGDVRGRAEHLVPTFLA